MIYDFSTSRKERPGNSPCACWWWERCPIVRFTIPPWLIYTPEVVRHDTCRYGSAPL